MSPTPLFPPMEERRWWDYAGPWPFRPAYTFVTTWLFYNITAVGAATVGTAFDPGTFIRNGLIQAFVSSLPVTVVFFFGRRWQIKHGVRLGSYVFFIAVAVVTTVAIRYLLVIGDIETTNLIGPLGVATTRITLFLLVTLAIAGAVTERLQKQVLATQEALEEARRQQDQILQADEQARRQVADLLHDRVQAGLITACLELQTLPEGESDRREVISAIVQRLENLRAIDVKRAARALSPSLHDVDLHAALRELGSQYEPRMVTSIDVSPEVESMINDPEIRLGLYRLTEQALMNSAIHGHARHVDASIRITFGDVIVWEVRDDGSGLPTTDLEPGLGSALMATWMQRLGGDWSLQPREGGGTVCSARIPLAEAPSQL